MSLARALLLAIAGLALVAQGPPPDAGSPASPASTPGAEVAVPGLSYSLEKSSSGVEVHLFRLSLAELELRILTPPKGQSAGTISDMTAESGALLGVNGSFFLDDFKPLGLLISQGRELQGLRKVDWGVFSVKDGRASLVHVREYTGNDGLEFAIESGPRLVVDGELIRVKPQLARRSMIGIDAEGRVLIAVTTGPVLLPEAARFMLRVGARYALNLDGGPSSQLSVPGRGLRVESFARVANGIGVFPRSARQPAVAPSTSSSPSR